MNSFIETLNQWSGNFLSFAWPMLWQSSLLIAVLAAIDFAFRRKLRASVRYALWLVVLVKLCIPPTLALPTSPAWWLHKTPPPAVAKPARHYTVTYDDGPLPDMPRTPLPAFVPPKSTMTNAAWLLAISAAVSSALLVWLLVRWWQVIRLVRRADASERLTVISDEAQKIIRMKLKVPVKLISNSMSPAVCGLFRPVILIPQSLAENFSDEQLRTVLLHELIHLRRRDVWVNFLQALLQIVYWWHPLVWLANARIRRVREEAVDDAVMLALRDEAEAYAPTLLEVAKLALNRPLASLGLVGILESRHALRHRIERLVDFRPPRKAGLTLVSALGVLAFTAVAVPMGDGPSSSDESNLHATPAPITSLSWTPTNAPIVLIQAEIYRMRQTDFEKLVSDPVFASTRQNKVKNFHQFERLLESSGFHPISRPRIQTASGLPAQFDVGNETNSIEFECQPVVTNELIDLASRIKIVSTMEDMTTTNQWTNTATFENGGGHVFSIKPPDDLSGTNIVVVTIGAEIVTNELRFHERAPAVSESPNQLAMTFKLNHPIQQDELKKKLLAAGVIIPPTVYFYHDNGLLLVRGSEEQLALVNRLMLQLNGYSPEEIEARNKHFPEQIRGIGFTGNSDTNLFSRHFRVDPAAFNSTLRNNPGLQTNNFSIMVKSFFSTLGVDWESPKGKAIFYNDRVGELFVKGTLTDFDTVERVLVVIGSAETNNQPMSGNRESFGGTNSNIVENKIQASHLVQDAKVDYEMGKLDDAEKLLQIALSLDAQNFAAKYYLGLVQSARISLKWGGLTPEHQNIAKKLDRIRIPSVSFDHLVLGEVVRQLNEAARENDPDKLGVNISTVTNSVSKQQADINSVVINVPALADASLADVLDAVLRGTKEPVKYSIMDDGVIFARRDVAETNPLYSRHFRVDANIFRAGVRNASGIKTNSVSEMARDFFKTLGVDLGVPGKSVFFNDRLGELFVRATEQDLDTIENAVEVFSRVSPQIHIKARFMEVPKGTSAGLKNVIAVTNLPAGSNQVAGLVGILTDKNFRTVLRNLEARPGVESLAEPEVVTTSGRQTQMRASTEAYNDIVNDVVVTLSKESNLMLDVVPYVLSDGYTINVTAMPLINELTGYVKPTNSIIALNKAENVVQLPAVLPNFTVRQVRQGVATLNVWDGQTVVLGGLPDKKYVRDKETVVRPEPSDKELLVFITLNIVDPAGNRIHSDDELPFAKDSIPSQPK